MRASILIASILASAPTNAADWTPYSKASDNGVTAEAFIDTASIRIEGSVRRAWFKTAYTYAPGTPHFVFFVAEVAQSLDWDIFHRNYDCTQELSATDAFSEHSAAGTKWDKLNELLPWHPVEPDSDEAAELRFICDWKSK